MAGRLTHPFATRIRVRYSEVDRMGLLYHVNHLEYFEVARSEWIRQFWRSYRDIEDEGFALVVIEATINYRRPAYYDDELLVEISELDWGRSRITFNYLIHRVGESEPVCSGRTQHCFVDRSGKVVKIPDPLRIKLDNACKISDAEASSECS